MEKNETGHRETEYLKRLENMSVKYSFRILYGYWFKQVNYKANFRTNVEKLKMGLFLEIL